MKTKPKTLFGILITLILPNMTGCGLKANSTNSSTENGVSSEGAKLSGVFVGGSYLNESNQQVAAIWKDGVKTDLMDGTQESWVRQVQVKGMDVYAAGNYYNGSHYVGAYWKNGVKTDLTDGSYHSEIYGLHVSDGNVYVAGGFSAGSRYVAAVWKNGVKTELTNETEPGGEATSVYVNGNNVYAGGNCDNGGSVYVPVIWKNGSKIVLTTDMGSVYSVTSDGNTIIAGGSYSDGTHNIGAIWKIDSSNQVTKVDLTDINKNGYVTSVMVVGGIIYAAGSDLDNEHAFYSKINLQNQVDKTYLMHGQGSNIRSVYAFGNDVYCAGGYSNGSQVASVWKNSEKTDLTDGSRTAYATSIFVQ